MVARGDLGVEFPPERVPVIQRQILSVARRVRRDPLRWVHTNVHYWDESLKSIEEAHAALIANGHANGAPSDKVV